VRVTIAPATPQILEQLAGWRYPPPYGFYDGDQDPVLNPERYYGAHDDAGELVGFLYYEQKPERVVEIGLGLRPDLTGRGLGLEFFRAGVDFAREQFGPAQIVLNVAAFNERAIAVYERGGFRRTGSHVRSFERWGDVEFVEMAEAPS
jgi:[ribosomal protein S18]-alanine N-acetyltransferase